MAVMPFDIFTTAAVADQLAACTPGCRIDKVVATSDLTIGLKLWGRDYSGWLVASASPNHPHIYLSHGKLAKATDVPPPFVMLLRKYFRGARIQSVHQEHLERVLVVDIATHEFGELELVAEIMGNRSNVILVSGDGEILGAQKLIGPQQSRIRRILPHCRYEPPPEPIRRDASGELVTRIDPIEDRVANFAAVRDRLTSLPADSSVTSALVATLRGCSPSVASDICARADVDPQAGIGSVSSDRLIAAIGAQFELLESRNWSPILLYRDGVPTDYRAYDSPSVPDSMPMPDISRAIEEASEGQESTDALLSAREALRELIRRRRRELDGRIQSMEKGIEKGKKAEELREMGGLVLGYQYQIEPGASLLELPDLEQQIPLDPKQTAVENAEGYFKRYRKAKEAARKLPALIEEARNDLAFVEELEMYVDIAATPNDLARIRTEFVDRFGSAKSTTSKKRPAGAGQPLKIDRPAGAQILVGRSARQNEEVTFKLAGRSDLWFHARGVPGAHVVLRRLHHDPDEALEQDPDVNTAASLAAHFSKARSERFADVIVARVRDIHRISGGAPGQVRVRNDRNVRVEPLSPDQI